MYNLRSNLKRNLRELPFFNSEIDISTTAMADGGQGENEGGAQVQVQVPTNNQANYVPRLRLNDFLPQTFDGKNPDLAPSHIINFGNYCQVHELGDDAVKIQRFKLTLAGEATLWLDGKTFQTYEELRTSFLNYNSGTRTRDSAVSAFWSTSYKIGETAEQYLQRLRRLGNRVGYGDDNIRDQFLNGLPQDARMMIKMVRPTTLAECVDLATEYIEGSKPKEVAFSVQEKKSETASLMTVVEELSKKVDKLSMRGRSSKRNFSHSNNNSRSTSRSHSRHRSPTPHRSKRKETRVCYNCGIRGHIARQCRRKAKARYNVAMSESGQVGQQKLLQEIQKLLQSQEQSFQ